MSNVIQFPGKKIEPNSLSEPSAEESETRLKAEESEAMEKAGKIGLLVWPVVRNGIPVIAEIPFKAEHGHLALLALSDTEEGGNAFRKILEYSGLFEMPKDGA
jgi:hypothetical protein